MLLAKKVVKTTSLKSRGYMIVGIFAIGSIITIGGYYTILGMVPVNGTFPVFGAPSNIYLKAIKSPDKGFVFATQSVKGGKTPPLAGVRSPKLVAKEGNLVSIHLINEDKNIPNELSKHNLNIDEFNVHTKTLHYFDTDTITFLADKTGTFEYHCTIHPEMSGEIVID